MSTSFTYLKERFNNLKANTLTRLMIEFFRIVETFFAILDSVNKKFEHIRKKLDYSKSEMWTWLILLIVALSVSVFIVLNPSSKKEDVRANETEIMLQDWRKPHQDETQYREIPNTENLMFDVPYLEPDS